jgi:hypothetical protein
VGAVPGQELVPELFSLRHPVCEQLGREQPFEEVVVPEVAVASRETDHARDGVRLEHGAHDVLRHPEPVLRRSVLGLEVARRQRAFDADPLEHALGRRGVLGEDRVVEPRPLAAHDMTEPGELARRDERQRLVGRLEDLTAFVERVAPGWVVLGDACVEHEVVVPAGDRDRIELDRSEPPQDLEHRLRPPFHRPRGREELPREEEAPRRIGRNLHGHDATRGVPPPGFAIRSRAPRSATLVVAKAPRSSAVLTQLLHRAGKVLVAEARARTCRAEDRRGESRRNA